MKRADLYVKYHDLLKVIADNNELRNAPDVALDNSVALDMLIYAMKYRDTNAYEEVKGIPEDFDWEAFKADYIALG
jgi:uncharacterized protein YihD (DUF1040 family)